jgi:hypothetical protein
MADTTEQAMSAVRLIRDTVNANNADPIVQMRNVCTVTALYIDTVFNSVLALPPQAHHPLVQPPLLPHPPGVAELAVGEAAELADTAELAVDAASTSASSASASGPSSTPTSSDASAGMVEVDSDISRVRKDQPCPSRTPLKKARPTCRASLGWSPPKHPPPPLPAPPAIRMACGTRMTMPTW